MALCSRRVRGAPVAAAPVHTPLTPLLSVDPRVCNRPGTPAGYSISLLSSALQVLRLRGEERGGERERGGLML